MSIVITIRNSRCVQAVQLNPWVKIGVCGCVYRVIYGNHDVFGVVSFSDDVNTRKVHMHTFLLITVSNVCLLE